MGVLKLMRQSLQRNNDPGENLPSDPPTHTPERSLIRRHRVSQGWYLCDMSGRHPHPVGEDKDDDKSITGLCEIPR